MIGTLYALCAYLFNCEIVQESGGALADFAYYEKVWQKGAPCGAGRRCPAAGRGRGFPPAGRGRQHAVPACLGLHPPFSLFAAPKRENGPCTVQKRKGRFWSSRKCTPFLDQTGGSLTRGRRDSSTGPVLRTTRFRLGKILHLPGVERQSCPPVPSQARSAGRGGSPCVNAPKQIGRAHV